MPESDPASHINVEEVSRAEQSTQNTQNESTVDNGAPNAGNSDGEQRRRRRREARRQRVLEEARAARQVRLEETARRMFYYGFFALPLLWLLSLIYFYRDYRDDNASVEIKKCTVSDTFSSFRSYEDNISFVSPVCLFHIGVLLTNTCLLSTCDWRHGRLHENVFDADRV